MSKMPKTANGKIIRDLMVAHKVKGNFKDFVVITGSKLMDWSGNYDFKRDGRAVEARVVALVHKQGLAAVIGPKLAGAFWRPSLGRVPPANTIQQLSKLNSEANFGRSDEDGKAPHAEPDEANG